METQITNNHFFYNYSQETNHQANPVSSLEYLSYSATAKKSPEIEKESARLREEYPPETAEFFISLMTKPQPHEIGQELRTAPIIHIFHSDVLSDSAQTQREREEILKDPRFLRYAPGQSGGWNPYIDSEPTVLDNGNKQYKVQMEGSQYFFRVDVVYNHVPNGVDYIITYHTPELPREVLEKAGEEAANIPTRPSYNDKGEPIIDWLSLGLPTHDDKGKPIPDWD